MADECSTAVRKLQHESQLADGHDVTDEACSNYSRNGRRYVTIPESQDILSNDTDKSHICETSSSRTNEASPLNGGNDINNLEEITAKEDPVCGNIHTDDSFGGIVGTASDIPTTVLHTGIVDSYVNNTISEVPGNSETDIKKPSADNKVTPENKNSGTLGLVLYTDKVDSFGEDIITDSDIPGNLGNTKAGINGGNESHNEESLRTEGVVNNEGHTTEELVENEKVYPNTPRANMSRMKQKVSFFNERGTNWRLPRVGTTKSTPKNLQRPLTNEQVYDVRALTPALSARSTPGCGQQHLERDGQFVYFVVNGLEPDSYKDKMAKRDKRLGSWLNCNRYMPIYENNGTKIHIGLPLGTLHGLKLEPISCARDEGPKNPPTSPATVASRSRSLVKIGSDRPSIKRNGTGKAASSKNTRPVEPCKLNTIELPRIQNQTKQHSIRRTLSRQFSHRFRPTNRKHFKNLKNRLPFLKGENVDMPKCVDSHALLIESKQGKDNSENATKTKANVKPFPKCDDGLERQRSTLSTSRRKNVVEMKLAKVDIVSGVYRELLKTAIDHYEQYPTLAKQKQLTNLFEKIKWMNSNEPDTAAIDTKAEEVKALGESIANVVCHVPCPTNDDPDMKEYDIQDTCINVSNEERDVAIFYKKLTEVLDTSYKSVDIAPIPQTCFRMMLPVM